MVDQLRGRFGIRIGLHRLGWLLPARGVRREELSDEQVEHIVATNLVGPIQLIRAALPHLRAQGGGRLIQISSYGGQVAFPGNSMYHPRDAQRGLSG